jgi:ribosome-associated protein
VPDGWLRVSPSCRIPLAELEWRTSRSGGPGGQHANTSDTRVEVRFAIETSSALGPRQRARLLDRIGPVASATASDTRSQSRNRELALERLRARLADGLRVLPPRKRTKPSKAAKQRRAQQKKHRSDLKRSRQRPDPDD